MSDVSERKLRQAAWRTAAAAALVLAAGAAATYWLTDGLRAYTLESARRLAASGGSRSQTRRQSHSFGCSQ